MKKGKKTKKDVDIQRKRERKDETKMKHKK